MDSEKGSPIDTRFTPLWHIAIPIIAMIILVIIASSPIEITLMRETKPTSEKLILVIILLIVVWVVPMNPKCYGKRLDSYDKCEECELIVACSVVTLEAITDDNVRVIPP